MNRIRFALLFIVASLVSGCGPSESAAPVVEPKPVEPPPVSQKVPPKKVSGLAAKRSYPLDTLQRTTLKVEGKPIEAYVMDDSPKREEGLMFLKEPDLPGDTGMLFVFPDAQPRSFWMHNTYMPLDLVYISADHYVDSIVHGKVLNDNPLPSKGPSEYVLELKKGDAKRLGFKPGGFIEIPANLAGR